MSRSFSARQKREAYLNQGGICPWCRLPLEREMEGHHELIPWARGGPTDIWNCELLHPQCHRTKETILTGLRDWQKDALRQFVAHDEQAFLVQAPVGAGKTDAALAMYRAWKAREHPRNPLCVILTPSVNVLRNWLVRAYSVSPNVVVRSLDLKDRWIQINGKRRKVDKADIRPASDDEFWLMSYQAVEGSSEQLRDLSRGREVREVFVIVDEVHRLESSEDSKWGTACEYAFQHAAKILCLSATPFRTSGRPVSFLQYDDEGYAVPNYRLSWKQARDDDYIVRIVFSRWDTTAGWTRQSIADPSFMFTLKGQISDPRTADDALSRAVMTPAYQAELLEEGMRALEAARRIYPDAAGMVVCDFQEQAGRIEGLLNERKPGSAFCAITENETSQRDMDVFRDRKATWDWMVTVGMAREGCDIPRIKVLVWLSRVKTLQNFIQVHGRIVRSVGDPKVVARSILPDHPLLAKYANDLLEEQGEHLRAPGKPREGEAPEPKTRFVHGWVEDVEATAVVRDDGSHAVDERMQRLAEQLGLPIDVIELIVTGYHDPSAAPGNGNREPNGNKAKEREEVTRLIAKFARNYTESGKQDKIGEAINNEKRRAGVPLEEISTYTEIQLAVFKARLIKALGS